MKDVIFPFKLNKEVSDQHYFDLNSIISLILIPTSFFKVSLNDNLITLATRPMLVYNIPSANIELSLVSDISCLLN